MKRCRIMSVTAVIGRRVSLGVGTIVAPLSTATTDIAIGRHVQLHVGAAVGHDVVIGDFVTLSPRSVISGHVEIGEGALVGAGAIILPISELERGLPSARVRSSRKTSPTTRPWSAIPREF